MVEPQRLQRTFSITEKDVVSWNEEISRENFKKVLLCAFSVLCGSVAYVQKLNCGNSCAPRSVYLLMELGSM